MSRNIPTKESIQLYFHCSHCLDQIPSDVSPRNWGRYSAGFTELGIQVVCNRCGRNVIHIDFEGQKHPANLAGGVKEVNSGRSTPSN